MKVIVWLAAEIILNCVGLDDLADYSEFVFERQDMMFALNFMYTQKECKHITEEQVIEHNSF
jgi:short-subunit dehydrogenase